MRFDVKTHARSFELCNLSLIIALCLTVLGLASQAQGQQLPHSKGALRIYFVDVEGGQATLFVTPDGHSLLVDTGWSGFNHRDADRIAAAAKQAGLTRLDNVLISHYHVDHVGGVTQLAAEIPIRTFLDHGPDREEVPVRGWQSTQAGYDAYQKLLATGTYQHVVLHAGEKLPVMGLDATVVSADGTVIDRPLPGAAAANSSCGDADKDPDSFEDPDMTENGRAVAIEVKVGSVRILDPADLTWDRERMLMCPVNKLGHINLFIVGNHGMAGATSPALVYGIAPQVAIFDNGVTKGAGIPALDLLRNVPSKPDIWQLHYAEQAGEHNTEAARIANLEAPVGHGPAQTNDKGFLLEVTVDRDGHFVILNSRTGESKTYTAN
jgi:competence protein ComEC